AAGMVVIYALVHGLIALFGLIVTVALLRPSDAASLGPVAPAPLPVEATTPAAAPDPPPPASRPALSPPVGAGGLLWKEVFQGSGREEPTLLRELAFPCALAVIVLLTLWSAVILQRLNAPSSFNWDDVWRADAQFLNPFLTVCAGLALTAG